MEWIGFLYKLRPMLVGFTPKKLTKMCDAVTPFSSAAAVTPTVKQAKSALGLLDHASNILLLGKAYFHVMRSQVTLLDSAAKSRTAPDRTPFLLSTDLQILSTLAQPNRGNIYRSGFSSSAPIFYCMP
jgi:hypothetical protein